MSVQTQWPMPTWLADLPDDERDAARTRYLLCLAAAFLSDRGNSRTLAAALGRDMNHINVLKHRGQVAPEMAIELERLLGRQHFPRELFRPDLFLVESE